MVDKILAHKGDSENELSGDEQPAKPLFQITTVAKQTGDSNMEEETKEPASDVAEQNDDFNEDYDNFDQQEVSASSNDRCQYDLESTMEQVVTQLE